MKRRSKIRWQHRLKRERPTCTERTDRSSRVRMEAWRQRPAGKKQKRGPQNEKLHLTPTGLLMEGDFTHNPAQEGSWCNGDFTTVMTIDRKDADFHTDVYGFSSSLLIDDCLTPWRYCQSCSGFFARSIKKCNSRTSQGGSWYPIGIGSADSTDASSDWRSR